MNRLLLLTSALFLAVGGHMHAAEFDGFSIDVPQGWISRPLTPERPELKAVLGSEDGKVGLVILAIDSSDPQRNLEELDSSAEKAARRSGWSRSHEGQKMIGGVAFDKYKVIRGDVVGFQCLGVVGRRIFDIMIVGDPDSEEIRKALDSFKPSEE